MQLSAVFFLLFIKNLGDTLLIVYSPLQVGMYISTRVHLWVRQLVGLDAKGIAKGIEHKKGLRRLQTINGTSDKGICFCSITVLYFAVNALPASLIFRFPLALLSTYIV